MSGLSKVPSVFCPNYCEPDELLDPALDGVAKLKKALASRI
jgi:hypothetical protein